MQDGEVPISPQPHQEWGMCFCCSYAFDPTGSKWQDDLMDIIGVFWVPARTPKDMGIGLKCYEKFKWISIIVDVTKLINIKLSMLFWDRNVQWVVWIQ